ncbi:tetracycline resistance MFS efflux pump [Flavobacterium branchiophilum NBRC 15030 = ATCC 35035]|uniref:MFS transporter n=1 Tax=Flavobacterium branchiophilum TaxID=55197 RepID=A0A2H3KR93_9FLAO|nr:TCR/Tet family MFS transporter [Flavobacterium branchiophilum]OXA76241.1 tetracycline resistance MFS efflux pump [Flavobacterium branchiophilum NBRC 15030 = ATCC 35035]PDS27156.1 MFS transporter [Flavobacterium branchiophilum]TQM40487.1 DHA1 family tetracycline resistance protein-like MFS transporter [Flavobacterium branchiophilum]GEM56289.1 tetracycline resistance MFS efflux pump [Flavobacterium branchiophilum NBRC 15030 = ATCC 35035]
MSSNKKSAAIGFIFITMLIDITGWGIIIPVIPKLIKELIHGDISEASKYGGWLTFAYAITQFLFAPLIGNLSDQYGRRPIILISLFAFSMDYLLLAFAPTIQWLFVGRIIAGLTGASITTASAYIADVSTPENRAKNFGMIGAAFGLGFIIGPVIGGILGQYGSRVPFYAAAVLCLVNFLYGLFILPESLDIDNRRPFNLKRANPIGAFLHLKKYPHLIGLVFSIFLLYIASHAVHSNWSYFTMYQFKWDEKMVGFSLGAIGLLVGIVQGGLIRVINPKLGNEKSIYLGMALYCVGMFLFATATKSWMMFVFLIPYCLGGIAGPAMQAVVSSQVPANEQGEIQGTLSSLMSASAIIGPPMMSSVFYYFTHNQAPFIFPGAPFVLGGILMFISTLIAYFSFQKNKS